MTFKTNASKWSYSDLQSVGVSYNKDETDLSDFMAMLKIGSNRTPLSSLPLPKEYKHVICITKKNWKFEFDFDTRKFKDEDVKTKFLEQGKQPADRLLTKLQRQEKKCYIKEPTDYERYKML